MESRGVFFKIWGDPRYGWMAYHHAMSIKYHSPSVPIHLCADQGAIAKLNDDQRQFFDKIEIIPTPTDPCQAKVSLYEQLPFEHNLFLDADGLCLQPLEPLFDKFASDQARPFRCFVHDYYDQHSPEIFPMMYWANKSVIWNHYQFNGERLPATQSSLLYIRKGEFCQELYRRMKLNYANRIPVERLREKWGGGQPDELYLNITLAQLGYDPQCEQVIYFANDLTLRPHQIKDSYYILSLFGPFNYVKPLYEREHDAMVSKLGAHFGGLQTYKWKGIKGSKHANKRMVNKKRAAFGGKFVRHERLQETVVPKGRTLLFTSYYDTNNPARQAEINEAILRNCSLKDIDHVYCYTDSDTPLRHTKLTVKPEGRPTYADLVRWASDIATDDDVVVITNSDIYLDGTINFVHQYDLTGFCLALSRWDMKQGKPKLFAYEHSQDTWIFKGKPEVDGGNYWMGLPGCDNRFAFDCDASGYKVRNVAKDIHTFHLHESNVRSYTQEDRLEGDYLPVFITSIRELPRMEAVSVT